LADPHSAQPRRRLARSSTFQIRSKFDIFLLPVIILFMNLFIYL